MKNRFLIFGILLSLILAISCEEDDVCVGEGTPYLTVVFRNNIGTANMKDSLTIDADVNPEFSNPVRIYLKEFTDSIKLPLGGLDETQTYFRIQRRSNSTTDILTVNYNPESEYVSKACGFRVTYQNLDYSSTLNRIEAIEPAESNELKNETTTNLYIRLSN